MISVHFLSKSFSISVIQVYAPTIDAEDVEVDQFYEDQQDILEKKKEIKKDILLIIGDWKAKVGNQEISRIIGKFGLWVQNEAG